MEKKKVGAILLGVIVIVFAAVMMFTNGLGGHPKTDSGNTETTTPGIENANALKLNPLNSKFEIKVGNAGLCRYLAAKGITISEDKEAKLAEFVDVNNTMSYNNPENYVITYAGHTVYNAINEQESYYAGVAPNTLFNFFISGSRVIPINPLDSFTLDAYIPLAESMLYGEETTSRIYVLDSEEEVQTFKQMYSDGYDILTGKKAAEKGQIILDGRLLPCAWDNLTGDYCVPMREIVKYLYTGSFINDNAGMVIVNSTSVMDSMLASFTFPSASTPRDFLEFDVVKDGKFTTGFEYVEGGKITVDLAYGSDYMLSIDSLIAVFGWDAYMDVNDNVLVIVTDQSNVSDQTIIKPVIE